MFRLKVSHLKAHTTFSLRDALPTLGSCSVYNYGIHLVKAALTRFVTLIELQAHRDAFIQN